MSFLFIGIGLPILLVVSIIAIMSGPMPFTKKDVGHRFIVVACKDGIATLKRADTSKVKQFILDYNENPTPGSEQEVEEINSDSFKLIQFPKKVA